MTDGQTPIKAPPGTLERRVQILEAIVNAMLAERGGVLPQGITEADTDGPWPKPPPPPPPPPGGGDDGNQTGG